MRKLGLPWIVICVAVLGLALGGCSGKDGKMGPAGINGTNGTDGTDGTDGLDGTDFSDLLEGFADGIKCATCHSSEQDTTYYVAARRYQWATSLHAVGGHAERNDVNCAGCHTSEGFQQRWREGWTTQVVDRMNNPSPPGCFACHSPHARNDFTTRSTGPVTIASFIAGVPDAVFDYGAGNICAQCHQTRTSSPMSPKPDPAQTAATDTITIASSRWYPHYGVNTQMLMGTGGFQFSDYTYTGNSPHTSSALIKQDGCAFCHMAEPVNGGGGIVGGHTWWMQQTGLEGAAVQNLTGCRDAACHGVAFARFDYISTSTGLTGGEGVNTYVERYLDTLKVMLLDPNVVGRWTAGTPKAWIVESSSGALSINAGTTGGLTRLRITPASRSGALYNFFFLEHEGSFGVHNSKYAIELLQSSIAELRKP